MSNKDKVPPYQRTAEALSVLLRELEPGTYLPSEPALAKELGVSRATLREAMRIYEGEGWIVRRQGVGTYVTQPPPVLESGLEELASIEKLAARIGLDVHTAEMEISERLPEPDEMDEFDGINMEPLVNIARVILAEGRPVAYLIDALPERYAPTDIYSGQFRGSVLDLLLAQSDPALGYSRTDITAVSASAEVARKLRIQRGDVLLCFEGWLYTKEGKALDHSFSYFLPGTFRFHVVRRVNSRI